MTQPEKHVSLADPLSTVTRNERRMLLGLSMLTVFFVKADALPAKINALGVELQAVDQEALLYLISAVLLYFVVAFILYAMSDYIVWRNAIAREYLEQYRKDMIEREHYAQSPEEMEFESEEILVARRNRLWRSMTKPTSFSRAVFEFVVPILVGLYSVYVAIDLALRHA